MNDPDLIRCAIDVSELSARRFAECVMSRDERTIRRWGAGIAPIPETARRRLEWFLSLPPELRRQLVTILGQQ